MLQNPIGDENIKIPFTRFSDGLYRVLIAIKWAGRPTRLLPHAKMLLVPITPGGEGDSAYESGGEQVRRLA